MTNDFTKNTDFGQDDRERSYSPDELRAFSEELKPYCIEREGVVYLSVGGEYAYLQDKGIIWAKDKVLSRMLSISSLPSWKIKDMAQLNEHENKMQQYWYWKGKKDYAKEMELLDWDKAYQKMPPTSELLTT